MKILLKKIHIIDPMQSLDKVVDILISAGKIEKIHKDISGGHNYKIMDMEGKIAIPSLFDMHAHFRTPGREDEETLLTGAQAALRGGFTRVCCMPNTEPPLDNSSVISSLISESRKHNLIELFPVGSVTKERKGKELTEMMDLKDAGAAAFSDDGSSVMDSGIMRRALEYVKMMNVPVISHCEDKNLSTDGQINEGYYSTSLGLKGMPAESESLMVARDIGISKLTDSHLHIAHVSSKLSVDLIRYAKKEGLKVTCETCPHYFILTEEAISEFDTNAKVNPPLRRKEDVEAIIEGLCDGTIDVIATDHAPHAVQEKQLEFDKAPFGMIGLETALALTITYLIDKKKIDWGKLVELFSLNPARILNKEIYTIEEGKRADFIVIDLKEYEVKGEDFCSLSKNSAFIGKRLKGYVYYLFKGGRLLIEQGVLKI